MLEIGAVQLFNDPLVTGAADIKELSKTHEIVSRSKTELWHRILTRYLPLYFPRRSVFIAVQGPIGSLRFWRSIRRHT